ncbi:MAG: tandem-95 repeat protein [Planctomycetota bacterium]
MSKLSRRFRQLFTKTSRQSRQRRSNRCLRTEQLEGRMLLAGDLLHNDLNSADVNNDGHIAPNDALAVINEINKRESGVGGEGSSSVPMYYDTSNDGLLSAIDVLITVNALAEGENPAQIVRYEPVALSTTFIAPSASVTFQYHETGNNDSIEIVNPGTRSWITAGFAVGGQVLISDSGRFVDTGGQVGPDTRITNNGLYDIVSVTTTTLTVQGNLMTTFPSNVVGTEFDDNGNEVPLAGREVSDSSAFFFRPIQNISAGGTFQLAILVEDLRTETSTGAALPDTKKGTFAGFVDVDSTANVTANGTTINDLRFHNGFTGAPSGSFSTPGKIDDAGAAVFGGSLGVPIGAHEQLLWRTPFTAGNSTGQATLMTSFAPDTSQEEINLATLLFGSDVAIPEIMIEFQSLSLTIASDIAAVNDGPFTFTEGSTNNNINVLGNDTVFNPAGTNPTITTPIGTTSITGGQLTFVGSSKTGTNYTFTPTAGFAGQTSFTYTISNGVGATATATVNITVGAVDDRPIISGPSSLNSNEDTAVTLSGFSITDPDSTNISVTLTANGTLSQTTFSGTPQQVTSTLNSITYTPLLNSNAADTLTISASDGNLTGTKTVAITITPVNDPPINTVPGPQSLFNTQTLTFTSGQFAVSDVDNNTLSVTLAITNQATSQPSSGKLAIGTTTGLQVTGNNSNSLTLNGTISALNAGLGSLVYDPLDTFIGTDTLTLTSSDGSLSDTDTVTIAVAPPQIPFAASDLFTADEGTAPFVLTPNPLNNDIRDAGATLSLKGAISPLNAQGSLAFSNGNFTYTPPTDPNFFGTDTFSYTIEQDAAHTPSSTGNTESTGTITVVVRPINDAPINTVPGAQTVDEDTPLVFNNAKQVSIQDIDAGTGSVTVTLTAGKGKINVTGGSGVTNNGSNNVVINGTVAQVNSTLVGLTYTPDLNVSGSDQLKINTNDNGNTGQGNSLFDEDTINITIQAINDAPTIVVPGKQSFFTDFDNPFTSTPNPFQISDVDAGNGNVQVDLTIGSGTLTLTSSTGVTVTPNPGGSNGVRLSGTVTSINAALASGVSYRTSVAGNKTLTAVVNDLGNTGGIPGNPNAVSPLTATATVDIELLDFVPIDIIGKVFIDHNGDGNRTSNEPGIGGVKVSLTGTDFQGNAVNLTVITDSQGNYKFTALRPTGATPYTITEEQPVFVESSGTSQAQFNLDLRGNVTMAGGSFNFAEGGFTPEFADVWKFFALSQQDPTDSGILFGSQGGQKWSILDGSNWNADRYSNPRFTPGADLNSGVLTVFDAQAGADRSANVSTQAGTLTYRGNGVDRVYRIIGGSELLGSVSANPEGENENDATKSGTAFARGVDALFASGGI